jgi:cytochrome P450
MANPAESPQITELKQRCHGGEENFSLNERTTCIFSAAASKAVSKENYADLTLPDRLIDLLLRRKSAAVSWQEVRMLWLDALRNTTSADALQHLYDEMAAFLAQAHRSAQTVNFSDLIQKMVVRSLLSRLVIGLSEQDSSLIYADQDNKLAYLLDPNPKRQTWLERFSMMRHSMNTAAVFRKLIKQRAAGKAPRQPDLLDGCVSLLDRLGMDRAVDAMVTVHTAVNGPPGAALSCLAYELTQHSDWAEQLRQEMGNLPLAAFCQAPMKRAPKLTAFVREVLRMWNVPVVARSARTDIEIAGHKIVRDSAIIMSPYFIHRNPGYWQDADCFKPERWLEEKEMTPGTYVPFGWAPKACIGSQLGLFQMMLLGRLLCTDYQLQLADNAKPHIVMTALPTPVDFCGWVHTGTKDSANEI